MIFQDDEKKLGEKEMELLEKILISRPTLISDRRSKSELIEEFKIWWMLDLRLEAYLNKKSSHPLSLSEAMNLSRLKWLFREFSNFKELGDLITDLLKKHRF